MNEKEKSPEQLREEMIKNLQAQGAQYMNEIATPGIIRPVKEEDLR